MSGRCGGVLENEGGAGFMPAETCLTSGGDKPRPTGKVRFQGSAGMNPIQPPTTKVPADFPIAGSAFLDESERKSSFPMTKRPYPGTGHAVLMSFGLLMGQIGGGVALGVLATLILGRAGGTAIGRNPATIAVINLAAFAIVFAWGRAANGVSWRALVPLQALRLAAWPAVVLSVVGAAIVLSEVDNIVSMVLPKPAFFTAFAKDVLSSEQHPWMSLFLLVAVAGTTEEIVFRGIILRGLLAHVRVPAAIGISALLFALVHANPWQFFGPLAMGILLGWWYVRTDSLVPCMAGHALLNGQTVLVRYLPIDIPGFTAPAIPNPPPVHQPLWFTVAGAVVVGLGVYLFHRAVPRPAAPPIIAAARPAGASAPREFEVLPP